MKFGLAIVLGVTQASESWSTTSNECFDEQGAEALGSDSDNFFMYGEKYRLLESETCNVHTFSRSAVKWLSSSLTGRVWKLQVEGDDNDDEEDSGFDDFGDFHAKLRADDEEDGEDTFAEARLNCFENGELT